MIDRSCTSSKVSLPALESTQRHLSSLVEVKTMTRHFALLGDPTRMKILLALAHAGELCVCDMADVLSMETSAISHQLRKLKDGDMVENQRMGSIIYYRLTPDVFRELFVTGRALLSEKEGTPS